MTMWFYYEIILIIIFNDILLNLPIIFIYHLFLPDYISNILNLIYLSLGIDFILLYCWNIPTYY